MRLLALMLVASAVLQAQRPRVLVLTDISSLTAGVREPDDGQSLIRLLLFSNEFDIEGLIATSNMGHGQTVRPELIHQAIDAYAKVHPNLVRHDRRYPTPASLRAVVHAGQPVAGPKLDPALSFGLGKDTAGSDWILRIVSRPDRRPLWVLIWGGSADLAQALWRMRQDKPATEQARLVGRLRVHSIYHQDSTGPVIERDWPGLYYMTRNHGIRGMYRGGDTSLVSSEWVSANAAEGHGALGALYPNYRGGDIWAGKLGRVVGVKEGDTPSFLFLFPNGLNRPERPELGGWGGRMLPENQVRLRWRDAADPDADSSDPDPRMSAVYRWRQEFQNEMAARFDWCVRDRGEANHAPVVRLRGNPSVTARRGESIEFDASRSTDPDGNTLRYQWSFYPFAERADLRIQPTGLGRARLTIPTEGPLDDLLHVVVRVQDDGTPSLSRYARVEIRIR